MIAYSYVSIAYLQTLFVMLVFAMFTYRVQSFLFIFSNIYSQKILLFYFRGLYIRSTNTISRHYVNYVHNVHINKKTRQPIPFTEIIHCLFIFQEIIHFIFVYLFFTCFDLFYA